MNEENIDLIIKVAKMCAKKAGLPDQDAISTGALRQALDIYCNLPETNTAYVECQNNDELQLNYDYYTGELSLWTVAGARLDMYQLEELICQLNKVYKGMLYIKCNNLHAELASEDEDEAPRFNCDCC